MTKARDSLSLSVSHVGSTVKLSGALQPLHKTVVVVVVPLAVVQRTRVVVQPSAGSNQRCRSCAPVMPALVVPVSYKMTRYTNIAIGVIIIISDGRQKDDPARWPPPKIATDKDCCSWCQPQQQQCVCVCARESVFALLQYSIYI
jgi:hypothetical protein